MHKKENPVGIDVEIQRIQEKLLEKLSDWNLEGFDRVYVLDKKPIWYYKKNDYRHVLKFDKKTYGLFFFVEGDSTDVKRNISKSDVDLIFLLDISKIKPNSKHRADEEVKIDIQKILAKYLTREILKITKGINALSPFETRLEDLQPYHFIKFSFQIKYKNLKNI